MMHKFLVQIKSDTDTRWIYDEKHLAEVIQAAVQGIVSFETFGPIPAVSVIQEERPLPKPEMLSTHCPHCNGSGWRTVFHFGRIVSDTRCPECNNGQRRVFLL